MNPGHAESMPRTHQFQIGKVGDDAQAPAEVARLEMNTPVVFPIFGLIENYGDAPFTLSVDDSEDNETYADIDIRVQGADVADIEVPAGGRVAFAIEAGTSMDSLYLQASVDDDSDAHGRLTLSHFNGALSVISAPFTVS